MSRPNRRRFYRRVFVLAGAYNLVWGLWSSLDPQWFFRVTGLPPLNHPAIFACLAMVVGLYGLIYFEVARAPERGWPLAAVGLLGKVLGPLGLAVLILRGAWPPSAVVLCLTNDLIWWVPFAMYLRDSWPAYRADLSRPSAECAMQMASSNVRVSPLDPIFAGHDRVPFAFSEQFLHGEHRPYGMRLEGTMHCIWHRPALLGPLFRLLGKLGILVPQNAVDVPATLVVRPGRDARDGLYHIWDRTFHFPRPVRFRTTIIHDPELGKVVDLVGPGNVLYMVWDARFHPPDRFTLDTDSCAFRIGSMKIWMPRWLWKFLLGTVTFAQVADPAEADRVHIDLLIRHPVFGRIFGYTGSFRVRRTEKDAEPAGADAAETGAIHGNAPRILHG